MQTSHLLRSNIIMPNSFQILRHNVEFVQIVRQNVNFFRWNVTFAQIQCYNAEFVQMECQIRFRLHATTLHLFRSNVTLSKLNLDSCSRCTNIWPFAQHSPNCSASLASPNISCFLAILNLPDQLNLPNLFYINRLQRHLVGGEGSPMKA